jgi:hypothetical protein
MRKLCFSMFALPISSAAMGQSSHSVAPQTVVISSGTLRLKAFLWKPASMKATPFQLADI